MAGETPGNAIQLNVTAERAFQFGLPAQEQEESDTAFRYRISSALRDAGHVIEAHEAYQGKLFDDPSGDVITGILGAVTGRFKGIDYGTTDGNRVGDDIATGIVARQPKSDADGLAALFAVLLSNR